MSSPKTHFAPMLHSERLTYTLWDPDNSDDVNYTVNLFNSSGLGALAPKGYWDDEQLIRYMYSIRLTPSECFGQTIDQIPVYLVRLGKSACDKRIGYITVSRRVEHIPMDLGFNFEKEYHGRGYGTEAARTVLRYWTEEFGLTTLILGTGDDNIAASRVAEKIGFVDGGWISYHGFESGRAKVYILPGMEKLNGQKQSYWGMGEVPLYRRKTFTDSR